MFDCVVWAALLQAALTYQQDRLALECLSLIEQNTEAVFKTRGFTELSDEALSFILKSDNLMADEGEILKAVKEWATVNSVRDCNAVTSPLDIAWISVIGLPP